MCGAMHAYMSLVVDTELVEDAVAVPAAAQPSGWAAHEHEMAVGRPCRTALTCEDQARHIAPCRASLRRVPHLQAIRLMFVALTCGQPWKRKGSTCARSGCIKVARRDECGEGSEWTTFTADERGCLPLLVAAWRRLKNCQVGLLPPRPPGWRRFVPSHPGATSFHARRAPGPNLTVVSTVEEGSPAWRFPPRRRPLSRRRQRRRA